MLTLIKQFGPKVQVNQDLCIGCGNCVFYCPNDSVRMRTPGKACFNLSSCRGCGVCVAFCPAGALNLEGLERETISSLVSRFASELERPRVLVFRCQWCVFAPRDLHKNVGFVDPLCAGRIQAFNILEAFLKGIDGVLIMACERGNCQLEVAGERLRPLVAMLQERLRVVGIQDRLRLCLAPPRSSEIFEEALEQFLMKMKELK